MQTNPTVYILDDESAIGSLVCKVLSQCGLQGTAFEDPAVFISKVQSDAPQLVILDLALGSTDAVDVIRSLEEIAYLGNIILMSGRSNQILAEITQVGVSRGLCMLPPLHKPFRAAELKARLAITPMRQESCHSPASLSQKPEKKAELSEALKNDWLELWYQPKIDLRTLSVCGAEALVRMNHPQFGVLSPGEFLPSAGDPLYHPLSSFVLARAISDWEAMATQNIKTKLSINMPASVVLEQGFVASVRALLPSDGSFPGLVVEVTEDEMVRDAEEIREVALQLKLSGVDLSIDDFGTAHASLARLRDLPCTEVKLDRSFVSNCSGDEGKRNICQTVVSLAKKFNVTACAEGVENREDLITLIASGFDTAQGYLFARPMPRAEFTAMMLNEALRTLKHGISDGRANDGTNESAAHVSNAYQKSARSALQEKVDLPMNYYFSS